MIWQFYFQVYNHKNKNIYQHRNLCRNVQSNNISNVKKIQTSINGQINCGIPIQGDILKYNMKNNRIPIHGATWLDFKNIMLNEQSQAQQAIYYFIYLKYSEQANLEMKIDQGVNVAKGWGSG